jgi:phage virion morphogenesis protein
MAAGPTIRVNTRDFQLKLKNFSSRIGVEPLLNIAGDVMLGSIARTFREQGSPAGSWTPLAASTLKRGKGGIGRKILIQSGRLMRSITKTVNPAAKRVEIGTNVIYGPIQQFGGMTGRGHKAKIPARPYIVFRPEDPQRIVSAEEAYIQAQAKGAGL